MSEPRILEVRLDSDEQHTELRADSRTSEDGDETEQRRVLILDTEADLHRILRPSNFELLRAIRKHKPDSMRTASKLVDRDFRSVHRNLTELDALNVIELQSEGHSKRPIVRFDTIDIELSLGTDGIDSTSA